MIAVFSPMAIMLVDFSLNQILIPKRQFWHQIVASIIYMLITLSVTQNQYLFPDLVEANCKDHGKGEGCMWSEFFMFHVVFMTVT